MPFKHDREQEKREANRAEEEAGGGEAGGFELSEKELIEQAENFEAGRDPQVDAGVPEAERSGAEFGDADHEPSSERPGSDSNG